MSAESWKVCIEVLLIPALLTLLTQWRHNRKLLHQLIFVVLLGLFSFWVHFL